MADLRNTTLTSEEQQIAAELMASIDVRTLGGSGDAVDRVQAPQRDDLDPGTLMSTVHSGSYVPGGEIGAAPVPADFAGLEYDLDETDHEADHAADEPDVAALGPTPDARPIDEAFDDGGDLRGIGARRPIGSDGEDTTDPADPRGEEPLDTDRASAGAPGRPSDGEGFVDDTAVETTGTAGAGDLASNGPAAPTSQFQSAPFAATPLDTRAFDDDDGDEFTINPPAEQDGGVTQQSQPNFADAPVLTASDASGDEDSTIDLDIAAALSDASESLSITISGVPAGASLSAGTDNGDGTWTLTGADLAGLQITPPADSDVDFSLTVTASSTSDVDTASTVETLNINVNAVADAPTLTANDVSGEEDGAIALDITSALTDTDGSEAMSVTISGVPAGATLSAGTDNGDGTWTLTQAQIGGLTITPPAGSDADFTLAVTATSTESQGDTAQSNDTFGVTVAADADAPSLTVNDSSGAEDAAIALDVTAGLVDTDGSETLSITVADVPTGATLSAGTDNGDGTWTLDPGDLAGLTVTPPAGSSNDFSLTVTATSTETENGDAAETVATLDVTVTDNQVETIDGDQYANKNDQLYGGDGEDLIHGYTKNDQVWGGDGDDTLYGDGGNDVLQGEAGYDTLVGGTGNDQLFGGAGNDTLSMGAGNDVAQGGDGSDRLIFSEGEGSNNVFHGGSGWIDTIELHDAGGGSPGEGWVLDLTSGEQVSSGSDHLELSQDSAGTITMEDGSVLTFDGVEKLTW